MRVLLRLLVATPLLAMIASTVSVYPHQLAYFNEAAGGPSNGHVHLLGSSCDWGQDVLFANLYVGNSSHGCSGFVHGVLPPQPLRHISPPAASQATLISAEYLYGTSSVAYDLGGQQQAVAALKLNRFGSRRPNLRVGGTIYVFIEE